MRSKKIWGTLDPFFEPGEIMGRSVANESFLRALLSLDPFDEYHFYLRSEALMDSVAGALRTQYPDIQGRAGFKMRLRHGLPKLLPRTQYHCFHLSDCINFPAYLAAIRNEYSEGIFPITGVTHSLSYERYSSDFLAHLWPGATRRDCVVATSGTAVQVVNSFHDYLSETYGDLPRPSVERIPLGVDTESMRPPTGEERDAARARLEVPDGVNMILVFARLSHYSKMDLVPILRAMQRLPENGVRKSEVCMYLAGWVRPEEKAFVETFSNLATNLGLPLKIIACPADDVKLDLYRAADVFLSPVDNPQETFGLTVLEAAAMGLPAVVSEYDGYRDLVVHGETGFMAPTIGPTDTSHMDRLAPVLFDNEYHLMLSQQTAVDIPSLARHMAELLRNPQLRRDMGRAARERVERDYSWRRVAEMHVELWDRLWEHPVDEASLRGIPHPLSVPYGRVFGGYTTSAFGPEVAVRWTRVGEAVYRGQDFVSVYRGVGGLVSPDAVRKLVFLARKAQPCAVLLPKVRALLGLDDEEAVFLILWCIKNDYLERVDVR